MSEPEDFVTCRKCGKALQQMTHIHLKTHDMTMKEYRKEFPEAPLMSGRGRKKRSVANTGKTCIFTDKHKANLSKALTGRTLSDEHRANISVGMTGKIFTAAHRTNISAAQTGKVLSAEHKAKISAAIRSRKGNGKE